MSYFAILGDSILIYVFESICYVLNCALSKSCVEALTYNVMVFENRTLGALLDLEKIVRMTFS